MIFGIGLTIFLLSSFAVVYTYVLYPLLLRFLSQGKALQGSTYAPEDEDLPVLAVLMAAHNEELVLEQKMQHLLAAEYPAQKLHIYVGSDCSTDATNDIMQAYAAQYPSRIHFFPFQERQGKPAIINQLAEAAKAISAEVLLITDANVMPKPASIYELLKHFKQRDIVLVDSNIQHYDSEAAGIGRNEQGYISQEVQAKYREGLIWGRTLGPLGGFFALRASHFSAIPKGYLVDDFYWAMRAFEQGGRAISELKALCLEDVSGNLAGEFRRKVRIASGNYKNLATFKHLLLPKWGSLAFVFWSHKVLRWLGPVFILLSWSSLALLNLLDNNLIWPLLFTGQNLLFFIVPLLDWLLEQMGIHQKYLRYIRYFLAMNIALVKGFINYIKGVKTNVWQPTKRKLG